jgi:hypothetical protein
MKKIILFLLVLFVTSSKAQIVKDLSGNKKMNYIFARTSKDVIEKELYNRGLFITIFKLSDSKATPDKYMEGFLSSYIISVTPDGDYYYPGSKLYKIEGFYNPKILEIKENKYPNFTIKIEYGSVGERKVKLFKFKGID